MIMSKIGLKYHHLMLITIVFIRILEVGSIFSNPNPVMTYEPAFIESNEYTFSNGNPSHIPVPANDSPTAHKSNYSLTFSRLQTSLPIKITLSLTSFYYSTFVVNTLSPNSAAIFFGIVSISPGGFAIQAFIQHVPRLTSIRCRYLAINEVQVGLFHFYEGSFNVNSALSTGTPISTTIAHSCPYPFTDYKIFHTLRGINIYKTQTPITFDWLSSLSVAVSGCTISLNGAYTYLSSFTYTLIYYKKIMEYNYPFRHIYHTKMVFITKPNCNRGAAAAGFGSCIVYDSATHASTVQVFSNNFFLGVYYFSCANSISYSIDKNLNTVDAFLFSGHGVRIHGILFYGYDCVNEFYYRVGNNNCVMCKSKCLDCNVTHCLQCDTNYVTDPINSAYCKYQPSLPVSFNSCTNFQESSGIIKCFFCEQYKNMQIDTQLTGCKCKNGHIWNSTVNSCVEICGDGQVFEDQCDDGNLQSSDGCSGQCQIEQEFSCNISVTPSFCESKQDLTYSIEDILKDQSEEGKGILILKPLNKQMPFEVLDTSFYSSANSLNLLSLTLTIEEGPPEQIMPMEFKLESVENNFIKLSFKYDFTVENLNARIDLNYAQTRYKKKIQTLNFKLKGSNAALKFSPYQSQYTIVSTNILITVILSMLGLLAGLFAPKFIGLETIITMQLIYYSQLLIVEYEKWPVGFKQFVNLKASTGYNEILDLTDYIPFNNLEKKFHHLIIHKTVIENLNVNFIVLLVFSVVFYVSTIARSVKENLILQQIQKIKANKTGQNTVAKPTIISQDYDQVRKINEVLYWMTTQLCFWSILPMMSALGAEFLISNKFLTEVYSNQFGKILLSLRGIEFFILFLVILSVGLNLFNNIFLSIRTVRKIEQRPEETFYKQLLFIYLFLMGSLIFFWNDVRVYNIPVSLLCLLIHLLYTIVLPLIKPYEQSLRIHALALYLNQGLYLLFLIILNVINFVDSIDEVILLFLGYFVSGSVWVLILLTAFRLYYQLRYGQALEKKIQEQRRKEEEEDKRKNEQKLKNKINQLELEAKKKLTEAQQLRNLNKYLIETQFKEQERISLLKWLQNRHWDKETKEKYYYKEFDQKPLEWSKENDEEDYKKKLSEIKDLKEAENIKRKAIKQNPHYVELTTKMRKDLRKKRKREFSAKKIDPL